MATLLLRIPFFAHTLYNWDSVNYALGLERFSVASHQPHAPGYIFYIAAGRLLQAVLDDANSALVAMSIIGSAAAVAGIYLAGQSIFNRTTGLVAALLLMFSALDWFYADIASPYSFMLPIIIACIWFIYQLIFHRRYTIAGAFVLGIAGGFRPEILFFLGPFWLFGTLRIGPRKMFIAWGVLAVSILVWLVPLVYLDGGITAFRQVSNDQYISGVEPSSIFSAGIDAVKVNFKRVLQAVFWMFGPACLGLIYAAGLFLVPKSLRNERLKVLFLLLILLLPFAFFILFLFDPLGYLLLYVAPLLLLAARGIAVVEEWLAEKIENPRQAFAPLAVFLIVVSLFNGYLFLEGSRISWHLPTTGPLEDVFAAYSAGGISEADNEMNATIDTASRFDPGNTVLVTTAEPFTPFIADWRRLMYYLPDYTTVMLRKEPGGGFLIGFEHEYTDRRAPVFQLPSNAKQILLMETHPAQNIFPRNLTPVDSNGTGVYMSLLDIPPDGRLQIGNSALIR